MRRRASSSLVLLLALVLCSACPSPGALPSRGTPSLAAETTCEYFGTRFTPFRGWTVEEHKQAGEPVSRVSLDGYVGSHKVLVSIIPRELRRQVATSRRSDVSRMCVAARRASACVRDDVRPRRPHRRGWQGHRGH